MADDGGGDVPDLVSGLGPNEAKATDRKDARHIRTIMVVMIVAVASGWLALLAFLAWHMIGWLD